MLIFEFKQLIADFNQPRNGLTLGGLLSSLLTLGFIYWNLIYHNSSINDSTFGKSWIRIIKNQKDSYFNYLNKFIWLEFSKFKCNDKKAQKTSNKKINLKKIKIHHKLFTNHHRIYLHVLFYRHTYYLFIYSHVTFLQS